MLYTIEKTLDDVAGVRAVLSNANHLLCSSRQPNLYGGHGDSLDRGSAIIEARDEAEIRHPFDILLNTRMGEYRQNYRIFLSV